MLKLIVNQKRSKTSAVCSSHCTLYDPITKKCGIWENVNVENPSVFSRCEYKLPFTTKDDHHNSPLEITSDTDVESKEWFEFAGQSLKDSESTYPISPDINIKNQDASWYVAPDQSFGCWVINHSKQKLMIVNNNEIHQNAHVYHSFYPLHDHKASTPLASQMCWYVNEDGLGRYVLIGLEGKIMMI